MPNSLYVTPETYELYTEIMHDLKKTPAELEEVNKHFFIIDDFYDPPRFWWQTPENYARTWDIHSPETPTEFAVILPK